VQYCTIINILAEYLIQIKVFINFRTGNFSPPPTPVIQNLFQNDVQTCENVVPEENLTFANAIIVKNFYIYSGVYLILGGGEFFKK